MERWYGRAERWAQSGRVGFFGASASLPAISMKTFSWPEVWLGGAWILRDGLARKQSRVQAGAEWRLPSLVTIFLILVFDTVW
jgi:hypothetical protein